MQELPIEKVKPGMKLACRVRNAGGEVIADVGFVITEKFLSQCEILGLYTLHVLGNPIPGAPKSYDAKKCFTQVPHLFRNYQENIFMRTLETFFKKHFHERI